MFGQSNEFALTTQRKIIGSNNGKKYTLQPPFGIDDHFQILAAFKASRQKPPVVASPTHSKRKKSIPTREFEYNPNMKTMYQYQYNDTGDVRQGYCDNRSVESLNEYFKRCQQSGRNLRELFKLRSPDLPPLKYRSDHSNRISEYAAEISYVGSKIFSSHIHDHSKCGRLPKNCVHYIEF